MLRLVLILLLLLVAITVGFIYSMPMLMHRNIEATRLAILQVPHSCPDGADERLERWGSAGYSRSCIKDGVSEGHWMAWEGKQKVIEGNFHNGKEQGIWTFGF